MRNNGRWKKGAYVPYVPIRKNPCNLTTFLQNLQKFWYLYEG
jgi:hypothetical protein